MLIPCEKFAFRQESVQVCKQSFHQMAATGDFSLLHTKFCQESIKKAMRCEL